MSDASRRAVLNRIAAIGTFPLAGAAAIAQGPAIGSGSTAQSAVELADYLTDAQRAAAQTDRPLDCTEAFVRAMATGRRVRVGPGHYALDALRIPNGGGLVGTGRSILYQAAPDRPAIHCVSDRESGQLADIVFEEVHVAGHPAARVAAVLLEARGAYAIWRSRFSFFARNCFRALEVQASDANNVFRCDIEVVSEGTRDTAVLVRGGVYNRYHLFLLQTQGWALDDSSGGSSIRVIAENSVIFRGQTNHVTAHIEGISATKAAGDAAIIDRGFGNTFLAAEVNMPAKDAGKLRYAFQAFQRSIFVNPQIIGAGAPPHPFGPTSNFPFTIIGGRSQSRHPIDATFDGSDPDRDLRNITFVGDVRDFTGLATRPGTMKVQRFVPTGDFTAEIAAATQVVIVDAADELQAMRMAFNAALAPVDGWVLQVATTNPVARVDWPAGQRFARLPRRLAAGQRFSMVYEAKADEWFLL